MTPQERDRVRLMVEVSRLYYDEERSQQEIADRLDVSRATVSRLLAQARGEGLVQITIRNPLADGERLERGLGAPVGLRGAPGPGGARPGRARAFPPIAAPGSHGRRA